MTELKLVCLITVTGGCPKIVSSPGVYIWHIPVLLLCQQILTVLSFQEERTAIVLTQFTLDWLLLHNTVAVIPP